LNSSFLGTGWKFPVQVDPSTGLIMLSEHEEDIKEAIGIIIHTSKGERVMRPSFGCGINEYLFDVINPTTLSLLKTNITEAIRTWEPRVTKVEVDVKQDHDIAEKLLIEISYVVRTTNNLFNQVYPFYLNEGTR
jgi:uncharacterized protein